MSARQEWIHHPEKVRLRALFFQIHLWIGIVVGLYIVLMSLTGALIVYRDILERNSTLVPAVEWLVDLHSNLLFGMNGRFVNGLGAICVILLSLTGAVIWWPGIADWRRALTVSWKSPLARLSWDLHSALGFWTLLFVLIWGISALYFVFFRTFNFVFGLIDPADRFTDKFLFWLSALHFGRFNWFSRAVWASLGLVPAALSVTGIFLCCRRVVFKIPHVKPF
jgi:uncharacterized iron-regulated membrane protein